MWLCVVAALLGLFLLRRWHRERQAVPRLSEKHVLITGCDSGFGNLLARRLDARGLRVLAACLTDAGAAQLRAATSNRLQTVLLDVTSSKSIADVTAWVRERVGDQGLWGLVNNAGIAIPTAPNEWLTKEDFVKVLDVNLVGLVEVTLSLLPLVRQARGRVVNVASVMGPVSCISKFGVEAFSDSLRRELRPFGVQVSIIEPGGFQTGMIDPAPLLKGLVRLWERLPAEAQTAYGRRYLDKYAKSTALLHRLSSSRLSLVPDATTHALLSRCPRSRYAAGWTPGSSSCPSATARPGCPTPSLASSCPSRPAGSPDGRQSEGPVGVSHPREPPAKADPTPDRDPRDSTGRARGMRITRDLAQAVSSSPSCFPSRGIFSESILFGLESTTWPAARRVRGQACPRGSGRDVPPPPGAAALAVPALAHLCPQPRAAPRAGHGCPRREGAGERQIPGLPLPGAHFSRS
ncbi:hypothetical protein DV515_00016063 [Chloebia gouldiae]|uniref:Retinol dehydrogenase 16 n=1 Tax=Chloebia gouldiae TaxID=44316 RepID=A0A3L8RUZ6_CHLGU|nr:hypothetical protein DV515_00016063 [Chloebia gouldiae]